MVDQSLNCRVGANTGLQHRPGTFLTLGRILKELVADQNPPIGLHDIHLLRRSSNASDPGGLQGPQDVTADRIQEYTRDQDHRVRKLAASGHTFMSESEGLAAAQLVAIRFDVALQDAAGHWEAEQ